jgi:hypothetical protein
MYGGVRKKRPRGFKRPPEPAISRALVPTFVPQKTATGTKNTMAAW